MILLGTALKPETFDNTEVFLSGATKSRDEAHTTYGATGSSLLSIRTDLKTFSENANPHSQGLSLLKSTRNCREQYVIRLAQHTVLIALTSYKAGENMGLTVRKPDTALKVQQAANSIQQHVTWPYAADLIRLINAIFHRNSPTCQFLTDSYDDEWTMVFSDPKNRTQMTVDITESELVPVTRTSPMAKARAKALTAPTEPVSA